MSKPKFKKLDVGTWGDDSIAPGEDQNVRITVSESYSGMNIRIPIQFVVLSNPAPPFSLCCIAWRTKLTALGARFGN
ncbi:MAG: hypothetical protein R3C03_21980 [Pirellulaceae bacterium]